MLFNARFRERSIQEGNRCSLIFGAKKLQGVQTDFTGSIRLLVSNMAPPRGQPCKHDCANICFHIIYYLPKKVLYFIIPTL